MPYIEYFETELIELAKEVREHPDLHILFATQSDSDIYVQIMEVATYLNIIVDGTYLPEEILKLCTIMTRKLREKRTLVISSSDSLPVQARTLLQ
jgi:hypothetical protein